MKLILGYKNAEEMNSPLGKSFDPPIQKEKRGSVPIAVIDDQTFQAGRNLRNYGYDIVEIGDTNDIAVVEKYSIILCDLMDVGMGFDTKFQGAALIREIRRNYPAIVVAAYTGSSTSAEITRRAKSYADRFIQKDAELETWREELDGLIRLATDPQTIWSRTRISLVEEGVPTKQILELEDAFVRSVNEKDMDFKKVKSLISARTITGAGADIAKGVISSAIFAVLMS